MSRGFNERTKFLRKKSVEAIPHISIERAKLITEAYKMYEGKFSTPVLRAKAFEYFMENRTLYIGDRELIVGEKGENPAGTPTYPELCCHTLDDFKIMDVREKISYKVSPEAFRIQEEVIIPYWEERATRNKIISNMSEDWLYCYNNGIFTEFMEQRAPGHTVCDHKIYETGFLGFKEKIRASLDNLDFFNDKEAMKKKEQLKGMSIACDAIIAYGKRYAEYARELAKKEDNPKRRDELLKIAENCDIVPANKPETFAQAIQMYWFVHVGVTTELNIWDAFSPGRLDQHLNPFYQYDIENNNLDRDGARELLECLWIKFNNQPAPPKVGVTLKESGTYTDFANINTGGITATGEDGVNDVSFLILDVMDEMKLLQPSSNVQISRKTPTDFLKRACEISRKGWGQPAFYNTEAIIQELLNAGKTIADARLGGCSGCIETGVYGKEAYILTGYFNLPKILDITLYNGVDRETNKQIGPQTGFPDEFKSYDELMEAFVVQLKYFIDIKLEGNNIIESIYMNYMPAPFMSVIIDDCITEGKDYNSGGARYNVSYVQGVGIGTITDSLASIKYNVFEKNKFSLRKLLDAMEDNFQGHDIIKNIVTNRTPKYGNDDDYADDIMKTVFKMYHSEVSGRPNMKGGEYRINMLPTTCHVYFGSVIGATPNGRLAHKPLPEGISPEKGADRNGPTAVIKSASKMDQLITGGTLLNQKFTPKVVEGENGLTNMSSLIRAYFNLDGHHIQFNVIDKEVLIEAQKHPEENKDLIVRVAGFSDLFNNLDKALQDEIIGRTEQTF